MAGQPAKASRPKEVDPDVELARTMRKGTAPWLRAGVLHVTLAVALLGGPWARGVLRAEASVAAFGRFAACIFGGTPIEGGGLALPEGDRLAFARRVRLEGSDWPARCEGELAAVGMDDAVLLMPSVRQREVTVRAAVTLVREELRRLDRDEGAAVSAVALDAIGRLQAALTELVGAAGVALDPEAPVIALEGEPLPAASRVPLSVAEGGRTDVRWTEEGLDFVASDARRVSVVRVRGGTVHEEHERRSTSARGLVVGPDGAAHLLVTTAPEACEAEEDHCVHRMTGLAHTDGTAVRERGPERWLRGHLTGRADRSAFVLPDRAGLLVATDEGLAAALFSWAGAVPEAPNAVPEEAAATDDEAEAEALPVPRVSASDRVVLGRARDALLAPSRLVWLDDRLHTAPIGDGGLGPSVAVDAAGDRLWSCGSFLVLGRAEGIQVRDAATLAPIASLEVALRAPLAGSAAEDEPVQLACGDEMLLLALLRRRGLDVVLCDHAACRTLASDVRETVGAAVAIAREEAWVAAWGGTGRDQVVVRRAHFGAPALLDAGPMPPCWSDGRGLCGPALFASDGERLALVVRENADALVLALEDDELRGLPGLR